jgi:hypothetical protein
LHYSALHYPRIETRLDDGATPHCFETQKRHALPAV